MTPEGQWSKNLFASFKEGGVWGIPRSGLIFHKRGNALVLVLAMPHIEEMPISAKQLREQQDSDFNVVREKFAEAGIPVRKEVQS